MGQVRKPGPAYPATVAAWPPAQGFWIWISVAVVADPGRGAERFSERLFEEGPGCVKGDADPCFEGSGLWAKCENRGPVYPATVAARSSPDVF